MVPSVGIINDNSNLKVENNSLSGGLVPSITINNGKSEFTYNTFNNISGTGLTFNNGTSEVNVENPLEYQNYNENSTDHNFPNYAIGYTAENRSIIDGNKFNTNKNDTYFSSVLLTDGNYIKWSDLHDGVVLSDMTFNLKTFNIQNAISDKNVKIYNFNEGDGTDDYITGSIYSSIKDLESNDLISNEYGQIYKISGPRPIDDPTICSFYIMAAGQRNVFEEIIPKNLNAHTLTFNLKNNINENLNINNFNTGYMIINGDTNTLELDSPIILSSNNIQLEFNNLTFNNNISGFNCNNLIFNNCKFKSISIFDNCNVIINGGTFNKTLSGINNSNIYCIDCSSTETLKVKGLSNSHISWVNSDLTDYTNYIKNGNYNTFDSILSSKFSGNELATENTLVNHYHQYPEYIIPIQYLAADGNISSYLDNMPIGSIIFWPEIVRTKIVDTDNNYNINERNKGITISSDNYVCITPILTGAFERCNGQKISINNHEILSGIIKNNFNVEVSNKIPLPNLSKR